MTVDRRSFLRVGAKYAGGALAAPSLIGLVACNDVTPAEPDGVARLARASKGAGGYGTISADPGGLPFLIPAGFTLREISTAGNPMKRAGEGLVPNALDGMAAFHMPNGNIRLIRNHEIRDGAGQSVPFGNKPWDAKAGGGCTALEVTVNAQTGEPTVIDEFVVLSGTCVNCAGGPTPWNSWLTCEETVEGISGGRLKDHGWVFEIPAAANNEIDPVSLNAMGRFAHEAVAVDPVYGHVYETEDAGLTSGFYRFIPTVRGDLKQGGTLQMLALTGKPQYNATGGGTPIGIPLPAHWVDVAAPQSISPSCYAQGFALGATRFARLEGCWWGDNSVYFNATNGGAVGAGQVWQYRPTSANGGQLVLVFESPNTSVLDAPDNICVSPRGGLVICEDGGGTQYLRGLTKQGAIFDFVRAADPANATEFAGACFSPDGNILFFNTQGSTNRTGTERGGTFAIWGPWSAGAL